MFTTASGFQVLLVILSSILHALMFYIHSICSDDSNSDHHLPPLTHYVPFPRISFLSFLALILGRNADLLGFLPLC